MDLTKEGNTFLSVGSKYKLRKHNRKINQPLMTSKIIMRQRTPIIPYKKNLGLNTKNNFFHSCSLPRNIVYEVHLKYTMKFEIEHAFIIFNGFMKIFKKLN